MRIDRVEFWLLRMPLVGVLALAGCATAPRVAAPVSTFEQKMAWILRLEDERVLRDPPPPITKPAKGRGDAVHLVPPPRPDLVRLLDDPEARLRRRASLAVGRVGLAEGVAPLVRVLSGDPEPEVRQMAAFALGLIGDRSAAGPLVAALRDSSPLVQGRTAEALGLMGDASAASAVGTMVAAHAEAAAVVPADEVGYPLQPRVEAFRLGVYALGRLRAYEALAAAVLDVNREPRVRWWPVAYALQATGDRRALPTLVSFARSDSRYGAAFAARGLGALKDPSAVDALLPLLDPTRRDPGVVVSAGRALAQIGQPRAAPGLLSLALGREGDANVRLEAVTALGTLGASQSTELLLDLLADPWPSMRAAALKALARVDRAVFLLALSARDPDPVWSVRAALAEALEWVNSDIALPRLREMLRDNDRRVIPAVLAALVKHKAPEITSILLEHVRADDAVVRMAAARHLGDLKPAGGAGALLEAYKLGAGDTTYVARAAALEALARYGGPPAIDALRAALADGDWAVRVRAAALLAELDPTDSPAAAIRPAPRRRAEEAYAAAGLVNPPVSPQVYIETDKGTIQVELCVLDAPLTAEHFAALASQGYFNGLPFHRVVPHVVVQGGDPRGDGEGGPGYTIRDELNEQPYLRGTVGLALDWRDTGGSQFFITPSPQPHLDGRYTVFGRVVAGIDVVDRLQEWDIIRAVRIWDGRTMTRR